MSLRRSKATSSCSAMGLSQTRDSLSLTGSSPSKQNGRVHMHRQRVKALRKAEEVDGDGRGSSVCVGEIGKTRRKRDEASP